MAKRINHETTMKKKKKSKSISVLKGKKNMFGRGIL